MKAVTVFDGAGLVGRLDLASGTSRQYLYDPQGSVAHTLDGSANLIDSRMYDAYGYEAARSPSGSVVFPTDPWGFDAQWGYVCDRELGTYYCQSRNYAPNLGRWLEEDPIGFEGGMNQYSYCAANPVGAMDADGLALTFAFENPFVGMSEADRRNMELRRSRWHDGRGVEGHGNYYYTGDDGQVHTHWPDQPQPSKKGKNSLGTPRKKSSETLRREWEKEFDCAWPTDPESGLNLIATTGYP